MTRLVARPLLKGLGREVNPLSLVDTMSAAQSAVHELRKAGRVGGKRLFAGSSVAVTEFLNHLVLTGALSSERCAEPLLDTLKDESLTGMLLSRHLLLLRLPARGTSSRHAVLISLSNSAAKQIRALQVCTRRKHVGMDVRDVQSKFQMELKSSSSNSSRNLVPGQVERAMSLINKFENPLVAVGVREGSLISHSPSIACLSRLCGFRSDDVRKLDAESLVAASARKPRKDVPDPTPPGWEWSTIRGEVRNARTRTQILESLRDRQGILADYIRASAKRLEPSTLKKYAAFIGNHLLPHFPERQIITADSSQILEAVEAILVEFDEPADENGDRFAAKEMTRRALLSFLSFLSARNSSVQDSGTLRLLRRRTLQPVDANFITLDELDQVLMRISQTVTDRDHRLELRAFFILSWSCGLRRGETIHLKTSDFIDDILKVRPDERHDLKTQASRRNVPWRILLDPAHRSEIENLLKDRQKLQRDHIFSTAFSCSDRLTDSFFSRAQQILRETLRDETLTLHHLRHSFATLFVPRFVKSRSPGLRSLLKDHPRTLRFIENGFQNMARLTIFPSAHNGIEVLSSILGHLSRRLTIEFYCHLLSLL